MALEDFVSLSYDGLCLIPLIGLLLTFIISYDYLKKRGLPPGPPSFPVIGNYLSLPKSKPWLLFTSWSKIYVRTNFLAPHPRSLMNIVFELLDEFHPLLEDMTLNLQEKTCTDFS